MKVSHVVGPQSARTGCANKEAIKAGLNATIHREPVASQHLTPIPESQEPDRSQCHRKQTNEGPCRHREVWIEVRQMPNKQPRRDQGESESRQSMRG